MGRILVVGVGNSVMGDDGLGVRALEALRSRELPDHVDTVEAGTALLDALPDLKEYDKVVLIDAIAADEQSVNVLRNPPLARSPERAFSLHEMGIGEALGLQRLVDGGLPEIVIMGIRPQRIEISTELSRDVASRLPELVEAVLDEIR
jgi:hydrogenase maturation protease